MASFQFQTVGNIISGLGSIAELTQILKDKAYKKLLLVTDAGMIQQQLHLPLIEIFETTATPYLIFSDVQADPPENIVLQAVDFAKSHNVDAVLGFGGVMWF